MQDLSVCDGDVATYSWRKMCDLLLSDYLLYFLDVPRAHASYIHFRKKRVHVPDMIVRLDS
jgi:hypothetical protein